MGVHAIFCQATNQNLTQDFVKKSRRPLKMAQNGGLRDFCQATNPNLTQDFVKKSRRPLKMTQNGGLHDFLPSYKSNFNTRFGEKIAQTPKNGPKWGSTRFFAQLQIQI